MKKRESVELVKTSSQRLAELEARNTELDAKIKKLDTVSGVEEEIRSKYSVAKESENMVIIVREEGEATTTTRENTGLWYKIKALFR